ncbi:UDP-2,4-diacetamido-2,4,6-trideoxy-beta-L-altropyranose hydrolase [Shewanella sp. SR43-8]|uniref:UDP-2,4-diacetamido-2,4, 6-trideoxy-beta-L-altropyranose hydrolase n=1 Tax=Shewanella sp. SR43-8 TaxID=2760938 RepID=UPI0016045DE9|nr:UDP-2,4-diacetamido-2,4,6-trideoxy-beta-L-altropyranose hydrolase [Shewanella sp. SR43-8]MBB1320164.1 UDP-2,4-diacetamido-2,4,6-trideoxy-beta-L-altropyranose hydrolase [Shewanella sp. SR43-8]
MNIVIRADASIFIGSGHIMRCLVLAEGLKQQNYNVIFACRRQPGDLVDLIRKRGFKVHELSQPKYWMTPVNDHDYSSWLQVTWQQDADSLLSKLNHVDLLIVDHYGLNFEWEKYLKVALKCHLFVIDDLVREHYCDLLLDQTLSRTSTEYTQKGSVNNVLAGCDYALLSSGFSVVRGEILSSSLASINPVSVKLLLSMGAIDLPNATMSVLESFSKCIANERPKITVLLGSNAPEYKQVKDFCLNNLDWITHIDYVDNMPRLMTQFDIAVGAAGITSWERACLGLPCIVIPLAENQRSVCKKLVAQQAVIKIELDEISNQLIERYTYLVKNLPAYRLRNLILCDGLGLKRVVMELTRLLDGKSNCISLRKACVEDIHLVYGWQCMETTRLYALNTIKPSFEQHQRWMLNKLSSVHDYFYILMDREQNINIGVVRLDRINKAEYVISIFIDSAHFGKRYASQALAIIDIIHGDSTIHATVLSNNKVSHKLFTSAGYHPLSAETYIREPLC